jgi:tyrosinase
MRVCPNILLSIATLAAAQSPSINNYDQIEIANGDAYQNLTDIADQRMRQNIGARTSPSCTYANADVRKEWRTLPKATRKGFTDAVICLQKMKPQEMTASQAANYPGVKSRFDEYVAT